MATPLLAVVGLRASYEGREVLRGIEMAVHAGEIVALLGSNGAGKSTLFRALFGVIAADRGVIRVEGCVVGRPEPRLMLERGVAFVPQGANVFLGMTVTENLLASQRAMRSVDRESALREAFNAFPELTERANDRALALSAGLRQMLAVGRALAIRPKVLLLDEPAAGLASDVSRRLYELLHKIASSGTAIVVAEHQHELVLEFAHRAYYLRAGLALPS